MQPDLLIERRALISKCKIPLKYSVATYSISVTIVSDVFHFVLIYLLTLVNDFILYSIDYFSLRLNNSIQIKIIFFIVTLRIPLSCYYI